MAIEYRTNIRPVLAAIKAIEVPPHPGQPAEAPALPFITISREPGAGGWTLAQKLVEALNEDRSDHPWTCWDRELVEKVAADAHVSTHLIESLQDQPHSWMTDMLSALSSSDAPAADEDRLYQRMASTIRALAQAGRVVIVGMGSVYVTRNLPGGIHVRLIATLEHRIRFMAQQRGLSHAAAESLVRELDRNRQAFIKRYWPKGLVIDPGMFTLTVNSELVPIEKTVRMVRVLLT